MKYHDIQQYIQEKFAELQIEPKHANFVFFWKAAYKKPGVIDEGCCCQWWAGSFTHNSIAFRTAEHAMMHGKAQLFQDSLMMKLILLEPSPKAAKQLGRKVKNFDAEQWDAVNYDCVRAINISKFSQHDALKNWMLSLPDQTVFVEASPFDEIWGIKRANDGKYNLNDPRNWMGLNKLGFALTEALGVIKQEFASSEK
jgi:ribA/ribD-fused uncharacterized protein